MNIPINQLICWLTNLATNTKDPYDLFRLENLALDSHPFGLLAPEGYNYPHSSFKRFVFFGTLRLDSSGVTAFEHGLVNKVSIGGFCCMPKSRFFRKITIEQPKDKDHKPIYFYEVKTEAHVFMVGGRTKPESDELRRLDTLFECMKWIYNTDIHEVTIPFKEIRENYLALKDQIRAHKKEYAPILEQMAEAEFMREMEQNF